MDDKLLCNELRFDGEWWIEVACMITQTESFFDTFILYRIPNHPTMILYIVRPISWKWRANGNGTTINRVGGWSSPQCSFLALDDQHHCPLKITTGISLNILNTLVLRYEREPWKGCEPNSTNSGKIEKVQRENKWKIGMMMLCQARLDFSGPMAPLHRIILSHFQPRPQILCPLREKSCLCS